MKNGYRKVALAALMLALLAMCGASAMALESTPKTVKATSVRLLCTGKTLCCTDVYDDPLNPYRAYKLKVRISPSSAAANTDASLVEYVSSNEAVAKVDGAGNVLAVSPGRATITVKLLDGSRKYAKFSLLVKQLPALSVTLPETSGKLQPGQTMTLTPTVGPATISNKAVGYASSNKAVATVTSDGVIKAVAPGTAKITVYAKTKTSIKTTYKVTVDYKYRVFAISNGSYKYQSKLNNAKPDLAGIKNMYKAARFDGGVSKFSYKTNLTGAGMRSYLKGISNAGYIEPDDVTIFYYSGHGVWDDESANYNGALVGVDAKASGYSSSTMMKISELTGYLSKLHGQVIVILDSCYSGEFITAKSTNGRLLQSARMDLINRGIVNAFKQASAGTQSGVVMAKDLANSATAQFHVITASSNSEQSWALDGVVSGGLWNVGTSRSVATYAVEEGTSGAGKAALMADENGDRAVSLEELYQYARPRALEILQRIGKTQDAQRWPEGDAFAVFAMN